MSSRISSIPAALFLFRGAAQLETRVADDTQLDRRDGTGVGGRYVCSIFCLIPFFSHTSLSRTPTPFHELRDGYGASRYLEQ